jgi:hypothetical protein
MENWKKAFWLTKLELRYYAKSFLLLLGILIMLLIFIVPTMADYFENSTLGIDVFFILAFCIVTTWVKPKQFQIQDHSNGLLLSPHLVMLNQLPTRRGMIVKHRFLTYIIISIPFNILFLLFLYILTPIIHDTMPIGTYLVFSIFWLCLSIYIGCSEIVTEAGDDKVLLIIRGLVLGFISVITMIIVFHKIYPRGFVHWTIYISTNFPVLVILISISLAIFGFKFWMKRMDRKIKKIDYL